MQLLALAGSLLVIFSVAVQGAENVGPCEKARQQAGPMMPGKYIPQCTELGYYKVEQRHASSGQSWCANPATGAEVEGTRRSPVQQKAVCGACFKEIESKLTTKLVLGANLPQCNDENGDYVPVQTREGYTFCVNQTTGAVEGQKKKAGDKTPLDCQLMAFSFAANVIRENVGPCAKAAQQAGPMMPGKYIPQCTESGYYKVEQRHASSGMSWCANPATGAEVEGTRRSPAQPKAVCGACFKEIESKLTTKLVLGANLPQCNDYDGDYVPLQHSEGYKYCVNYKTGAIEGPKKAAGDKTPLSCQLMFRSLAANVISENVGPCAKARQEGGPMMPGKYLPQCTEFGFFKPTQCHGSIGKCWCVVPDTGKQVDGSSAGEPDCSMCYIKRAEALRPARIVGNYVPECDEDGLFTAEQHHGSTGQSWCVNKYTGEELQGSRFGPGQDQIMNCTVAAMWSGRALYHEMDTQGPCYAKIVEARGRESMPGFYTPGCTARGYFKTEQTHSSSGYSWCVNPATGAEVMGTRRSAVEPKATCGACFKEIEEKLTRKPMLGADMPTCNSENGDYAPEQHREGYSFCVNPKTGAVEGKKNAPGDKTPLPCVNH